MSARDVGRGRDGVALAGGAVVLYLVLGQHTFYAVDSQGIVKLLASGGTGHYLHFLFMPVLQAVAWLLAPLALEPYRVAVVASAIGSALGVLFVHRAALVLGLGRAPACAITLLVATTPAVLFFATVVEFHGLFFAFAGLAWWMAGRLVARPSLPRAIVLGAAIALAGFVHGTGQLLVVPLLAFFAVEARARGNGGRPIAAHVAIAVATHATIFLVVPRVLDLPAGNQIEFWGRYLADLPPLADFPGTLSSEWLLAFAPLSVLWLPALARETARLQAAAFLAALLVYLTVCFVLIPAGEERGAYLLPLAPAAAIVAQRVLRPRVLVAAAILALLPAVAQVRSHDVAPDRSQWVADLRAATRGETVVLLLGNLDEVNPLARHAPDLDYQPFYDWVLLMQQQPANEAAAFAGVDAFLLASIAAGKTVYLSDGARSLCAVEGSVGARLLAHLEQSFILRRVEHGSFAMYRIARRG